MVKHIHERSSVHAIVSVCAIKSDHRLLSAVYPVKISSTTGKNPGWIRSEPPLCRADNSRIAAEQAIKEYLPQLYWSNIKNDDSRNTLRAHMSLSMTCFVWIVINRYLLFHRSSSGKTPAPTGECHRRACLPSLSPALPFVRSAVPTQPRR